VEVVDAESGESERGDGEEHEDELEQQHAGAFTAIFECELEQPAKSACVDRRCVAAVVVCYS
jgi:hypothetical protein